MISVSILIFSGIRIVLVGVMFEVTSINPFLTMSS